MAISENVMKSRVQHPSKTKAPVAQGRRGLPGGAILVAGLAVAAGLVLTIEGNAPDSTDTGTRDRVARHIRRAGAGLGFIDIDKEA